MTDKTFQRFVAQKTLNARLPESMLEYIILMLIVQREIEKSNGFCCFIDFIRLVLRSQSAAAQLSMAFAFGLLLTL